MSRREHPQLIFANIVNHLMIPVAPPAYAKALIGVSPRKIWLAEEADVVVTPRPIGTPFKQYACSTLGIDPNKVVTLSPEKHNGEVLSRALHRSDMVDHLRALIAERPGIDILCFALDHPTLELAADLGVSPHGYDSFPHHGLQEMYYSLNTKSGFRAVAEKLGLRVVPGVYCEGLDILTDTVERMLKDTGAVIIKYDRSSNGYGHIIMRREDMDGQNLRDYLVERTAVFAEQPHVFTVEMLMQFVSVPSIEMIVDAEGARWLYSCDQRCPNGSFAGMVTPPIEMTPDVERELLSAGELFGRYVHNLGFRGICDVDGGVTADGILYVTESNFRRTGGTYLDTLVRRLIGDDYLETHVWFADARLGKTDMGFFAGLSAIEKSDLAFDRAAGKGIILTADTLEIDGKWRYLIIAPTIEEAEHMETKLEEILHLTEGI